MLNALLNALRDYERGIVRRHVLGSEPATRRSLRAQTSRTAQPAAGQRKCMSGANTAHVMFTSAETVLLFISKTATLP